MTLTMDSPTELRDEEFAARLLSATLLAKPSWMESAACGGRTQLFFGSSGERPQRRVRREARAYKVCASCPVLEQCRTQARENRESGYWGGESEEQRAAAGYPPLVISRRSVHFAAAEGQTA